jgi:hypothetical protein
MQRYRQSKTDKYNDISSIDNDIKDSNRNCLNLRQSHMKMIMDYYRNRKLCSDFT